RQRADAALTERLETRVLADLNLAIGEVLSRPAFAAEPLSLERWLEQPASAAARSLWLGRVGPGTQASIVMLRDLRNPELLPHLARAASTLPGVRWVDKTAEVSSLLGRYRLSMSGLL